MKTAEGIIFQWLNSRNRRLLTDHDITEGLANALRESGHLCEWVSADELRAKFEEKTGTPHINSQGEPDIDYVAWLEFQLTKPTP